MQFYSQKPNEQDYNLETYVFKGYKNGFFVDVGAYDGKIFNNTLYFEETHNWTGINIEPLPDKFQLLEKNRPKCINLNLAIDEYSGETDFCCNDVLSGIINHYDQRHITRINTENIHSSYDKNIIKVKTRRLDEIFRENNVKTINYLSIDVEGAEMSVIKTINFDEVFIDIIDFENNYSDNSQQIIEYLKNKEYYIIMNGLDIIMIHSKSQFINNF